MEILFFTVIILVNVVIMFLFLKSEYDSYQNNKRFCKQLEEHEKQLLDITTVCTDSRNLISSLRDKTSKKIFEDYESLNEIFKQIKKGITDEYKEFLESVRNVNETVSVIKEENKKAPYTPIETLGLSARAQNALINNGIGSVEELSQCKYTRLFMLRGVGQTVYDEIVDTLKEKNIILPNKSNNAHL